MSNSTLTIDLDALYGNWRTLDRMSSSETAAVVKADGYGLGAEKVALHLFTNGVRRFFVALPSEAVLLRKVLGPEPEINVFAGHQAGDADLIRDHSLTPMLNSPEQFARHRETLPDHGFGVQLDSGMGRLGFQPSHWANERDHILTAAPTLIMSHLACADEPDHPMNPKQLVKFRHMTDGLDVPRSLSATGGILLGSDYHFDLTRPGIGLYGGLPFESASTVAQLHLPVVQIRNLIPGDTAGYGNTWTAERPSRIATVAGGYADGLLRSMTGQGQMFSGNTACPIVGRVSMDLITVDVTDLDHEPETLEILGPHQSVDQLADAAGTIGYEILTSLGGRYDRRYTASP